MRSHYDVLGVEPSASREEIRQAYRALVRQLHPDRHTGPLTPEEQRALTARLVAVTDAWKVLGDEDKRVLYDQVWQAAARRAQLITAGRVIRPDVPPMPWRPPPPPPTARPVGWERRRPATGPTAPGPPPVDAAVQAPPDVHEPTGVPASPPGPSTSFPGPSTSFPGPSRSFPGQSTSFPGPSRSFPGPTSSPPPPSDGMPGRGPAGHGAGAGAGAGAAGPWAERWGGPWPPAPADPGSGCAPPPPPSAGAAPGSSSPWMAPGHPGRSGHRSFRTATHGPARPRGEDGASDRRRWRPRRSDECRLCGSAPAVAVDLRAQRSGILRTLFTGGTPSERGPLCRSCGLAVLRDLTDVALCGGRPTGRFGTRPSRRHLLIDVLALGWLLNFMTVVGNLSFWFRLHRLAPPTRDPEVRSPLTAPLDPGDPLRSRRGGAVVMVVTGAVLVVVAVVGVVHVVTGSAHALPFGW